MAYGSDNFDAGVGNLTAKNGVVGSTSGGVSIPTLGDYNIAYLNTVTCATQTQVAKIQNSGTLGLTLAAGVRMTTAATKGGYFGGHNRQDEGNDILRIWKRDEAGAYTILASHGSQSAVLNDTVELRATVNGSNVDLELFLNGSSVLTVTDSTAVLSGTRVGLELMHGTANVKTADNFEGGDYNLTPSVSQANFQFFVGSGALPTPLVSPAAPVAGDCTNSGNNTASTSWALSRPAQVTGDMIICHLVSDANVTHGTLPGGPNGETAVTIEANQKDTSTANQVCSAWYWIATGSSASGSVTVTPSASEQWQATVLKIPAGTFNSAAPIQTHNHASSSTDTSSPTSPALTATNAGGRVIAWFGIDTDPVTGTPAGWTSPASVDVGAISGTLSQRTAVTTASESVSAGTWTIAADSYVCIAYIIDSIAVAGRSPFAAAGADVTLNVDTDYGWQVRIENAGGATTEDTYRLQYKLNSGSWTAITSASSVVKASATADFANGADVPQYIGGSGTYITDNNAALDTTGALVLTAVLGATSSFESHLNFRVVSGDVVNADTIQLRAVYDDGTVLEAYTDTPTITVSEAGSTTITAPVATHTYTPQATQLRVKVHPGLVTKTYTIRTPKVSAMVRPSARAHSYTGQVSSVGSATTVSIPARAHTYAGGAPGVSAGVRAALVTSSYVMRSAQAAAVLSAPMRLHSYTMRTPQARANVKPGLSTTSYVLPAIEVHSTLRYSASTHVYLTKTPQVKARVQPSNLSHTYVPRTSAIKARVQTAQVAHTYAVGSVQARASVMPATRAHTYSLGLPTAVTGPGLGVPTAVHTYVGRGANVSAMVRPTALAHTYAGSVPNILTGFRVLPGAVTHTYVSRVPKVNVRVSPAPAYHQYYGIPLFRAVSQGWRTKYHWRSR